MVLQPPKLNYNNMGEGPWQPGLGSQIDRQKIEELMVDRQLQPGI